MIGGFGERLGLSRKNEGSKWPPISCGLTEAGWMDVLFVGKPDLFKIDMIVCAESVYCERHSFLLLIFLKLSNTILIDDFDFR